MAVATIVGITVAMIATKESGIRVGVPLPQEMPVAAKAVVRKAVAIVAAVVAVAIMAVVSVAWLG